MASYKKTSALFKSGAYSIAVNSFYFISSYVGVGGAGLVPAPSPPVVPPFIIVVISS